MATATKVHAAAAVDAPTTGLRAALVRAWNRLNVAEPVPQRRLPSGQAALAVRADGLLREHGRLFPQSL